jgi:hypothetical protein
VRLRVDDRHLGLAQAQLLGEAQRHEEPDVPGPDHQNSLRSHASTIDPRKIDKSRL